MESIGIAPPLCKPGQESRGQLRKIGVGLEWRFLKQLLGGLRGLCGHGRVRRDPCRHAVLAPAVGDHYTCVYLFHNRPSRAFAPGRPSGPILS